MLCLEKSTNKTISENFVIKKKILRGKCETTSTDNKVHKIITAIIEAILSRKVDYCQASKR